MSQIIIRTDASLTIGTGHVMRCLNLAEELKTCGCKVIFTCRTLIGNMIQYIRERGFTVWEIECATPFSKQTEQLEISFIKKKIFENDISPSWLIIDHYAIDELWERSFRRTVKFILVIDDLANRIHDADILLDQNLTQKGSERYKRLVPKKCELCVGPSFLLLDRSFYNQKRKVRERSGEVKNVLLFFGGTDPTDELSKAIDCIEISDFENIDFDIVIGRSYPKRKEVINVCEKKDNINLHIQTTKMADLITKADFCIGAGGVAMWERCYLGLPSSVTITADNQQASVDMASKIGLIWNLGPYTQTNLMKYTDILVRAIHSSYDLKMMSKKQLQTINTIPAHSYSIVTEKIMNSL